MAPNRLQEQLTKHLTGAHSIEERALAQVRSAPKIVGDPEISAAFERHLAETAGHESIVRRRLEQERSAAEQLFSRFGEALDASLSEQGVGAR